jgi:hypothetical protein
LTNDDLPTYRGCMASALSATAPPALAQPTPPSTHQVHLPPSAAEDALRARNEATEPDRRSDQYRRSPATAGSRFCASTVRSNLSPPKSGGPFTVAGLGGGGIGVSTIDANGEVYKLRGLGDFAGAYAQGRYGFALGNMSGGDLWLQNDAGVILHLKAKRTGLMLSLGGDAVVISMQ